MNEYKTIEESLVEMTELVLPNDTNLLGNLLGGRMMHWIDIAGAMAAMRHSNTNVATVAVDSLDFKHPIRVGEAVILKAYLTWVGNTSMEVKVDVYCENLKSGATIKTNEAYISFVALNDDCKPVGVSKLKLVSEKQKNEFHKAIVRREERLTRKNS